MRLKVSPVNPVYRRGSFPTILLPSFVLGMLLMAWAPSAKAQVSELDPAGGEISGTVLQETDKRPASQVAVSLKSRVAGVFRSVLTDLEGHFKVQNLPPDTYDIEVDEQGYEPAQTSTKLAGSNSQLVMYLKSKSGALQRSDYSVSVRELQIPKKAHDELQKGLQGVAKNDLSGSLDHFRKALKVFPGYFEAYYNLGVAEMKLGRSNDAMAAFQTAIDLSGGRYAWAEFAYGYLLCQAGRPGEAEKIIRRGLEVAYAGPEGYVILSEALILLNRSDDAEKTAQEALLRNANFAPAYLALANVDERKGDYRAEIHNLDIYLKLLPDGPASDQARRVRDSAAKTLASSEAQDLISSKQP